MKIIFCEDPLNAKAVDSSYQSEAHTAQTLGIAYQLISFESLTANSPSLAVKRIFQADELEDAIYRGWMLTPLQYEQLYKALLERNLRLINTPEMYRHCHYLPESYAVIADYTPKSQWLEYNADFSMQAVHQTLKSFGNKPLILKDFVKSQKHYWYEACYIPDASDRQQVERVVKRFLELQGDDLNQGLVFREYVDFQPLTQHSRSEMPLTEEYRVFVANARPIFHTKYWSEGDYGSETPELGTFEAVMQNVRSNFYTMDIARQTDGQWMIVELGDGQVAGLPEHADIKTFYESIIQHW